MLKQFASGDFSENTVVEKTIPKEYKNETEQIRKATVEVKKQIRDIILNTKQEAENISTIAEGTSSKMTVLNQDISGITDSVSLVMEQTVRARELADNSKQAVDKIRQVAEGVVDNVSFLSKNSGMLLEFMTGKVIEDYKAMIELARMYESDAEYESLSGEFQ